MRLKFREKPCLHCENCPYFSAYTFLGKFWLCCGVLHGQQRIHYTRKNWRIYCLACAVTVLADVPHRLVPWQKRALVAMAMAVVVVVVVIVNWKLHFGGHYVSL